MKESNTFVGNVTIKHPPRVILPNTKGQYMRESRVQWKTKIDFPFIWNGHCTNSHFYQNCTTWEMSLTKDGKINPTTLSNSLFSKGRGNGSPLFGITAVLPYRAKIKLTQFKKSRTTGTPLSIPKIMFLKNLVGVMCNNTSVTPFNIFHRGYG